ncbi:unknown protein [Calothrix sp. PCC 7716]|nr:unknown protein [Calothrix sp. PCC 7716]
MLREPKPTFLHQLKSDEFLPPISLWTTLGGIFLLGTVGGALTLAASIKYSVTVKALANVRPVGEIRLVQPAMEGQIREILVKENQFVKKGEAIATIDNSQFLTRKKQLQASVENSQQQLAHIDAQLSLVSSQRDFEQRLFNHTINSSQANLQLNQRDYQQQQVISQTEVQEAKATLELTQEEMQRYRQLASSGAIATLQVKEKEQAYKAAYAKLQRAKAALNPSNGSVAIATEEIAQSKARGKIAIASLDKEREILLQRQIDIRNKINQSLKEIQLVTRDLEKAVIRSPESGTVLQLTLRNPNQIVRIGESIAQIAPANANLLVKARVAVQDISRVRVCQQRQVKDCEQGRVQMRISAYPYPDYGTLQGAVRAITPDIIIPQSSNNVNTTAPYYEVTIEPERLYLSRNNQKYLIQSGMEVRADIISRQETVLSFFLRKARFLTNI